MDPFYLHLAEFFLYLADAVEGFLPLSDRIFGVEIARFDDLFSIVFQTHLHFLGHSWSAVQSQGPSHFSFHLFLHSSFLILFAGMDSCSDFFGTYAFELIFVSFSDNADDVRHLRDFPMKEMRRVVGYLFVVCIIKKMFGYAIRDIFHDRMCSRFQRRFLQWQIKWFCAFRDLNEDDVAFFDSFSSSECEFDKNIGIFFQKLGTWLIHRFLFVDKNWLVYSQF